MYLKSSLQSNRLLQPGGNGSAWSVLSGRETQFNQQKLMDDQSVPVSTLGNRSWDTLNGTPVIIAVPDPQLKNTLLEIKDKNGMDWDAVEDILNSENSNSYVQDSLGGEWAVNAFEGLEFIDKMVVNRSVFENEIKARFAEDMQAQALERLNANFTSIKEAKLHTFASAIEDFFARGGQSVNTQALMNNLHAVTAGREDDARAVTAQIPATQGTADAVFDKLGAIRSSSAAQGAEDSIEGLSYEALLDMGKAITEFTDSINANVVNSDETLGLNLGFAKLKAQIVVNDGAYSTAVVRKFMSAVDGNLSQRLGDIQRKREEELSKMQAGVGYSLSFRPLSQSGILRIANRVADLGNMDAAGFKDRVSALLLSVRASFVQADTRYADLHGYIDPRRPAWQQASVREYAKAARTASFEGSVDKTLNSWNAFLNRIELNSKDSYRLPCADTDFINLQV